MKLMRNVLTAVLLLATGLMSVPVMAGFLQFPLHGCGDAACTANYTTHGAYTANAIVSVLDHSMAQNSNGYFPYGTTKTSAAGGDLSIRAFNGEVVSGAHQSGDFRCIGGTIYLHPDWNPSVRMTNDGGCGPGYSSYDEHPGYDYRADAGKPVYAAQSGTVISTTCYLGNIGTGTCESWGALAINHTGYGGNGYFSQYLHMDTQIVTYPGMFIAAGTQIGTVGGKCGPNCTTPLPAHLHFEVRHIGTPIGPEAYPVVDPYGWVGGGADTLYSAPYVAPANLWQ